MNSDIIIGIDLGTTNSLVAVADAAGPRVLAGPGGERMLPSVLRLDPRTGEVAAIGTEARRHAVEYPTETVFSVKRLMGRGVADVEEERAHLPYAVTAGPQDTARVQIGEHLKSPQELSARLLMELKRWAEASLGQPVHKAVVTVPAYFDDAQRQATRDAGRLAGLEVVRIVNEPTAAALAYGLGAGGAKAEGGGRKAEGRAGKGEGGGVALDVKVNPGACASDSGSGSDLPPSAFRLPPSQTVAVYDLGGGTFDISILRLQPTEHGLVDQVLATAGDTHLGGDDVDRLLIELIQREIREQHGADLTFPPATRQAFRTFAEATKIRLSEAEQAAIEVDLGAGRTYRRTLTRVEFEAMIAGWIERTLAGCRAAMKAAGLDAAEIDRVVLVGGSTRIPVVRRAVGALFQAEPYTALNPDEVVALGAAVQASILTGDRRDLLLLDVIPLSLGIETMGGAVAKLIMANQTIPARATETFSTYVDGQTNVKIHVLQGERETVEHCRSLGTFELRRIPPMPAGLPKIAVTFLVDANGILSVQAVEQRSGKRAAIQVVPNHGLTRDEVARIEAESFTHAREDMTRHRLIDLRLNAKLDIRHIRQQIERVAEELDAAYRQDIEGHVAAVERFIATPDAQIDADAFARAMTAMDHATVRLAELNIARTLREES